MLYNLFENRDFVSVFAVALLAEGVDRNMNKTTRCMPVYRSPSSRRAWIEIAMMTLPMPQILVALLAEGVDRNLRFRQSPGVVVEVALLAEGVDRNMVVTLRAAVLPWSPSSRRAWIEMILVSSRRLWMRSPSSRRAWIEILRVQLPDGPVLRRPPRGGRG